MLSLSSTTKRQSRINHRIKNNEIYKNNSSFIEGLEELLAGKRSQFTEEDIWLMEPVMRFVATATCNGIFNLKVGVWPEGKMGDDIDSVIIEQTVTAAELASIIAKLRLGRKVFSCT